VIPTRSHVGPRSGNEPGDQVGPDWGPLSPPPIIVGAVGGSGTRVLTRLIHRAGVFVGSRLNEARDSEPIMEFYDGWLRGYLESGGRQEEGERQAAESKLRECLRDHLASRSMDTQPWAVKVPRNILALPFWHALFPNLKFIHVIRNGFDMAYSSDRNQLGLFGDLILSEAEQLQPDPVRQVAYWRAVNLDAARFGEETLSERYLVLRFEDICSEPRWAYRRVCEFIGLRKPATRPWRAILEVGIPSTIGRWRGRPEDELAAIETAGQPALERFGYLRG
jgi:hypothetical protein